jgi:conjugal transfer pilus assembly protein TraF
MCPYRILMVMLLPFQAMASDGKPTGWLWYQDPTPLVEEKKQEASKPSNTISQKPKTAVEEMAANRKHYDEVMAKGILYPTIENVTNARRAHDAIIAQASQFQESWTVSELLDQQTPVDMTSPGALKLARQEEEKSLEEGLKKLSKTYGLIFVFKEDCPYCHEFAPLVKHFAQQYDFKIEGLSAGEGCFEGMNCLKNKGAVDALNPEGAYPLLYLANPATNDLIPIAKGFISQRALLENVKAVIQWLEKQGELS